MSYYAVTYEGTVRTRRRDGLNDATIDSLNQDLLTLLKQGKIRGFAMMRDK